MTWLRVWLRASPEYKYLKSMSRQARKELRSLPDTFLSFTPFGWTTSAKHILLKGNKGDT
jgi:hypothetical protein